jgi:uncharacterized protein YjlB
MDRKTFISLASTSLGGIFMSNTLILPDIKPEEYIFADDGHIPNSKLPLLIYHGAFIEKEFKGAEWLEKQFAMNNWSNSWRWGVYSYHHYHSNTHEVLGVFSGWASLQLGGEAGKKVKVKEGDVIVIPAGTGHKNVGCSSDFMVVGAYPNGVEPDLMKGNTGERPAADKNIVAVPVPEADPLMGTNNGLRIIWK